MLYFGERSSAFLIPLLLYKLIFYFLVVMKTVEQRLVDEQNFHNQIFQDQARKKVGRFYSINGGIRKLFEDFIFSQPKDKVYLEYGCGMAEGNRLTRLTVKGAKCYGIDIGSATSVMMKPDNR